ncbi:MAG: amidase, partial [Actinobacteria bacterium]|nr:amidase [Actinomycetota bacterium]
MELTQLDALATARAVREGDLTATAVAAAHLSRSERLSPVVGAFARL